jgi:quercetin dioxygenase-like cupin family protein
MGDTSTTRHLNGGVVVRRFEFIEPPITNGGRLRTPGGEIAQIANGSPLRFVAYIEFNEGVVRGNHFHVGRTEMLYIIRGRLQAAFESLDTGDVITLELHTGDLITTHPGHAHQYRAVEYTQTLELSESAFDPDSTLPHPM